MSNTTKLGVCSRTQGLKQLCVLFPLATSLTPTSKLLNNIYVCEPNNKKTTGLHNCYDDTCYAAKT